MDSSYVGANLKQSYITCNKIIKNFVFFAEISFQKYPKCLFAFRILRYVLLILIYDLFMFRSIPAALSPFLSSCHFAVFVGVVGEGR